METQEYKKEAIDWLKKELSEEKTLVAFSGGKDSVVIAQLAKLANIDHTLVYTNTTIDPPAVLQFIKRVYPQCLWVRPKESFWKMIPKRNPPLRSARWCCTTLKKAPSWKLKFHKRIMGIRAEESGRRKEYPRINHYTGYRQNHTHYYPILHWPEWAVWEFIEQEKLEVPNLYEKFDRLGCVVCPMRGKKQLELWKELYPGYFKAFEAACKKWYKKRVSQNRTMAYSSSEKFVEAWYAGTASWYAEEFRE